MKFNWTTIGRTHKSLQGKFDSDARVQIHREVETQKLTKVFNRIGGEEFETVIVLDDNGSHIYSCDPKFVRRRLKEFDMGQRDGWTIMRIGTYEDRPVEIEMMHEKEMVTVRK